MNRITSSISAWASFLVASLACCIVLLPQAVQADDRKPLLMPDKQSLYQRVLARPGAEWHAEPVLSAPGESVVPFDVYYVYGRQSVQGLEWVEIATNSRGQELGWIQSSQLIPWKQALTVTFREPLGHDRVMLFRDRASLKSLIDANDIITYRRLYREAVSEAPSDDSPVAAIQPAGHIDIQEDFYLVPIQQHEDIYLGDQQALLLKVSSVPLIDSQESAGPGGFRSGIVFVIDSTISMGPYIERTREAIRKVYRAIANAGLLNDVNFGLTAYRDNVTVVPQLEYLTRTYAMLEEGRDPSLFFQKVKEVRPAEVSSRGFMEDAYAGVLSAIETTNWNNYDSRFVVLVTDAGARSANDPLGSTGLDAEGLRQLAQDRGTAIVVLHLLTPQGRGNHAAASTQYRQLSHYPGIGDFYYGVPTGNVAEFGRVVETLAGQIVQQVRETARGLPPMPVVDTAPTTGELVELQKKVAKLGYALRMRYLQRLEGGRVPAVFDAWLVDRDFARPDQKNLDVRVLLTRDQLSDLQSVLKQVLETAEEGVLSPRDFLNDLQSLAATISRDPAAVARSTRATGSGQSNLADLGYMREYIEDLPYAGEVMKLSLESWEEWPAKRQLEYIHDLESRINYYQALHDNPDLWVSLNGGPVTGDSVFPVALEMLP